MFLGAGPRPVLFGRVVTGRAFGINSLGHCVSAHLHRGLSRLLHTELDWLDVPEQVVYKLDAMVFNCLLSQAPPYLWNCANQSHHGNISDLPPDSSWLYRVTNSAFMTDGLSVWLVRRSGILCRTACGIRLLAGTVSDNLRRRFCLQRTHAFSALEVSRRCTI